MWDWISKLHELSQRGEPAAVVTLTGCAGSTPRELGAKMLVTREAFFGTIGGGKLEALVLADARRALSEGTPRALRYPLGPSAGQCCGGVVDAFVEVMNLEPRLYLFGAGHVGKALAQVLAPTPFRVEIIDDRDEWIGAADLPEGVVRHHAAWDDVAKGFVWDAERTFVVIMTHRHDTDQDIVEWVTARPTRYVGLIGSQTKWARFKSRLAQKGIGEERLARVKCPLGLDIGGKTPHEVAISAAAELIGVYHRRVQLA